MLDERLFVNHVGWLSELERVNAELGGLTTSYRYDQMEREATLGLAYRRGELVYDGITGERGEVLSGTRKRVVAVPGS